MATMARGKRRKGQRLDTETTADPDRWRARVKVMGYEFWLGTFDTKAEAEAAEEQYRSWRREQQIKQGVAHA